MARREKKDRKSEKRNPKKETKNRRIAHHLDSTITWAIELSLTINEFECIEFIEN